MSSKGIVTVLHALHMFIAIMCDISAITQEPVHPQVKTLTTIMSHGMI